MIARWGWLALLLAAGAAYAWVVAGVGPALIAAGRGLQPFDLRIGGYSRADAAAYLLRIGPEGRAWYLDRVIPADLVFAGLFAAALGAVALRLGGGVAVAVLAALPGLCDLAETLTIARMLAQEPAALDPGLVARASVLTQAKWAALVLAALVLARQARLSRGGGRG
ncbi:MAG: hypothetical protein ACK4OP_05750 [Gemmobacter sp.]